MFIPEGAFNSDDFGGMELMTQSGYHLGLGVFTSAGSAKIAIGQVGACYYLIKKNGPKLYVYLLLFILIAVAYSLVSRTGVLFSVVGLLMVFYAKYKQGGHRGIKLLIQAGLLLIIGYIVITGLLPSGLQEDSFQRYSIVAERGIRDTWFSGYLGEDGKNVIPPISFETLIGLGITQGVSGTGIITITDGGFMRNYSAMGLVVAIINYVIIASFFFKRYNATKSVEYKGIILFMAAIILIGEFKEYYIYYLSPMCFLFLILSLIEINERTSLATSGDSYRKVAV